RFVVARPAADHAVDRFRRSLTFARVFGGGGDGRRPGGVALAGGAFAGDRDVRGLTGQLAVVDDEREGQRGGTARRREGRFRGGGTAQVHGPAAGLGPFVAEVASGRIGRGRAIKGHRGTGGDRLR